MIGWILKFIPAEYKWSVAIKKVSYTVGKLAVAALSMGGVKSLIGTNLTPDQTTQIEGAAGALTAALLEGIHDWAKLKWPNSQWL